MNKIFKVIWSKSKQCYIVVSEMAKNHSGKKKIVVASILAAMAVGSGALVTDVSADPVRGGVSLAGGETKTDATIAIGSGSYSDGTAIGGDGSRRVEPGIAIGVNAKAMGNSNVVMGLGSQIIGHSFGVAIGRTAQATDDYGVSVGYNTHADLHGIAMGEQSRAKKTGATSFGVSSRGYGNGAIAVGWQSLAGANVYNENGVPNNDINTDNGKTINDYDKWGDVAIGVRTIATGGNATALGRGATASAANAIAIGGGDGGEPTKSGNTASDNKEKTKATAEKAVAIGYKALASDKNATSIGTDAQATQARATAIGYEVRAVGKNAVAIGSSGENSSRKLNSAGENAISIGTAAQANNLGSTAIGNLALASSNHAVAIGTSAEGTGASSTAIGHLVKATESNAFAAGSESLASGKNSISIGSTFNNITNQSTGEASIAIGAAAQSTGAGSVALGRNVQALKEYTTAVGMNIKASDNASASTILGYNSYTKANQSVNIGSTVKTEAGGQYSTAIGYTLSVSGKNAIGIGSSDDGITDDKKLMATGESSIAIGTRAQGKASGATAIGKEAVASHTDAIALGTSAQGTGEASTAIGNGAKATNSHAFAAGVGANAAGNSAIAVGNSASAAKDNSVAIGTNTTASEIETVAVGLRASAQGKRSVSLGIDTESTTADGVSVGYLSKSQALGAVAIGRNAVVTAEKSTAVGYDLTVSNSASTNIGYTSTVAANQATSVGARNSVESGAQYGTALGYFVNISGKNAIGIGSSDDKQNVVASAYNAAAIGTSAQATASSAMALGTNANAALAHSVALGEGSTTTEADGAGKTAYLSGESTNNSGNGVISVGNKRNDSDRTATITRRIVSVAGGTDDFDAVNVKQLKALESKERHIKVKTGNDAYTPDANGKITLNYVNGKGEDVPNEVTEIKDVAKKSDEWTLRTQDGNTTAVATPQTVNGLTKKAVTLKAGDNIAIENNNGVVTIKAKDVVKSVATDNTNALDISNTNGAVKINPKLASSVNAAGEANKLVTAGTVKTALDDKIDKTAEMHIKSGEYTVNTDGTASLIQQNGNNQDQSTRVTIKDIAKKSVVDTLQSDYNTFRTKAITFTGDDNQGVARTLDTTLTVKGGANYTSTIPNTNIRVEKDGTTGLAVKLSDKLTGIKEISGTGSQDLVINNGNTKVTVKAPSNGDNGTVDFGNAKVVAPNLDASISYKAGNGDTKKTVKLQDGFNFTAATDTTTTAEGPKSGLAIKAEDNGKVTFGLDKATRNTIDNAADKNLSNLTQDGKNKVTELAKTAAKEAVKVAPGLNTTVTTDTSTAGVTTYKVNANDTTVAAGSEALTINNATPDTNKVRAYTVDLSAVTKGKLAAVGNLATNVIGGTTIAADGTVTGPTFSITNAAGTAENAGTIKEAIEKLDAANKGQNTKISDTAEKVTNLATALGGGAKVENGTFTGPTYNITKANGSGTETASNVGEAITKLDNRITTANGTLVTKGLDFTGNDTTNTGKVHRDLGTTLTIKGAENFTRAATETNNIKVVKNGDALDVKLAENLAKMKEISGDGASDLVIKNGDTKVTVKAPTSGDTGTVDFGKAKVVAPNLDASISYKAGNGDTKKTVKLQDGFNFTAATDTTTTAEGPKSGLAITTGANGEVTFGLDKATRSTIDNAADKDLSNLTDTGKTTVKELAKGAAQDAVKVANGINTTVTTDTATTGVTTYKVNANDTTVAVTGTGLAITGGDLGTDKVRKYSLDLSDATKGKLKAVDGLSTVIGGTNITTDGTVTGPTFNITKADGTTEEATTIKDAIDKLNATNAGQNTKISETESKVKDIVDKGMTFAGDDAAADKVTRKLGETLNIHGQNNITVKKDGTAADTLNVKLASELKNITSISSGNGTTGSTVTLDADGVSIANTKDGATKTVTIGKDGINAGGMKITNVAEAKAAGDAANKKYVDDAISNLGNIVSGNATLNFAGNVTKNAQDQATEKVGLSLATGTLHVNGAENEITTTAKGDTITVGLAETVKAQLAKVGDTASNGRDGKDGTSGAKGLTGKDGLNDKTLTDKVNALRNGEAGSVVYTNDAGDRVVKAKDGKYYKADEVKADGTVKTAEENKGKAPKVVENPQARVVNGNGETTAPTTLSNIADGKVAADSKEAVNGGQLYTAKSEIGAIIGGTTINENGKITGPTFSITNAAGTKDDATTIKDAIEKLDATNAAQNTKISGNTEKLTQLGEKVTENYNDLSTKITQAGTNVTNALTTKGLDFTGNDTTAKVHHDLGTTLTIKGADNFTRTDAETNNIKVVKNDNDLDVKLAENLGKIKSISNATGAGKPGSTITLGADGVSIANTAAGQDGAAGETKTVTIGKAGINAGGMKVTNVAKAEADGDAANKAYVDNAISNLNTTVTNNANLRYAGDTNEGVAAGEDHLNLPLATGTLKVAGTADQIKTVANNGTITLSLDEKVTNKLDKLGDTAANGRDGKAGTSGAQGLTGKDGLNDKTLTDKVNALRNGEAGSVVYTNEAGDRVVKAKDGKYYKADEVKADGTVKTADENNGKAPEEVKTPQARLVNPNGETTVPTTLSNIADGKVAADSKDAVNGGQLYTAKSEIGAIIGGTTIAADGTITGPKFNVTKADGTTEEAGTIKEAIEKLDATNAGQNTAITNLDTRITNLVDGGMTFNGDDATADKVTRKLGETLNIHGQNNITVKKDATAADTLNVKLASDLKNITSISSGDGTTGSKVTLGTDGVSIANTAAGQGGAAGDTKTVTIGKDGINAGGMKITNVADAEKDGDAANKKYVDNAISNLNTTVTNNANLRYAGDTNEGAAAGADHLNLPLATGTLKVAGTADQIKTVAKNGTITLSLDEKVTNKLDKLGDTAANGRDGKAGTSGAQGLTGKDGLNDKTLTDKVNALRNGEAGSVVYTNEAGDRVVKAKDGKYYKADEVKADGTVKTAEENKGKAPEEVKTPQARVVNPNGETTAPTTLSNIADGKVAEGSKEAVNGGQLHTVKSDLATALGGGAKVENGTFTGPTYNITKDDGTGTEAVKNVGDAITKLDGRINNANTVLGNKGLDFTGNDTTDAGKVHRNLGETLTIKGADNFTRTDAETNNIKVVKNNNDLDVKLAENLGNIKEIAGNGKDDLVIKNGDATITLKPKKDAEGTNPATPATVDFGNAKVVAPNLEASITYRANSAEDANAKTVTLQKGLNFVSGDGTAATAEAAKAGITIAADKDGKVVFGLNEATRNAIDNAADKNLSNLSQDGKDKVADLAKTAARDAVKVAAGNNVTVTPEIKDGNTTYTVSGRDTTVKAADNGSVSVTGGTLNAKGEREYTVDLTADAKAELGKISDLNTRLGSAEGKITTLQGDMTKAKDDIAANTKAIDANKEGIAANKNAIADNARDIAANRKDIDANKQGIAENKKQIGENAKAIAKNAEDIKKNVEDTKKNTQDIKKNADAIKANTDRIQTVENRVTTAEGKIATNEKAIKDNASAIQSNTKAIGANTTAIAKNANDITKANKEIESLKGNSATKDLSNLTNTGKDTITNLINVTGEHGITVTPSTDTTTRVKTFTAKLNDTVTFGSGDKKITVDGTTGTVTSKAVAADTVKANTVNAKTVQLGDSTGTNTTVTADGIAVTTKNPDGTTSKVEIKNGTVSGLTNTKWDPAKVVTEADRSVVATQGQVKDVTDTLARGRVFVGDTGNTVTVGLGDTLAIKGGSTKALTDDNIGVVSTEAKDGKPATMTVKLAKNVNMKDGSTSYDSNVPEVKINPDGSKEIVKNADGTVKYQLGEDGKPIHITTTVNAGGVTIAPNQGSGIPTVSLTAAGLDNGGHQIHNVAAGTANTDAATVGQVRAAAHALNNRVNEAGAHAAALAAMNPLSYDPLKKSQVMAGYGAYKGSNALALGVAHYANEDTLFNVGVSVGNGENMVNAGVTYRFGGEDSMIPERYKGGPISSVYVMQDEITALKAENARKDAENAKKEAENEEMKAQIKMLIERVTMLEAKK